MGASPALQGGGGIDNERSLKTRELTCFVQGPLFRMTQERYSKSVSLSVGVSGFESQI